MSISFRKDIPGSIAVETVLNQVESELNVHRFATERNGDRLLFERKVSSKPDKFQIVVELFKGLTKGQIDVSKKNQTQLVCRVNYQKHGFGCLLLALVVGAIFSWVQGFYWKDMLRIAYPIFLISMSVGILNGNSKLKWIVEAAMYKCS